MQGGDLGTQMVSGKPPRYPVDCRRRREQGTVVLALTLGVDGAVQSISVARSSGFPRLDEAALGAVRSWRWAPVLRGGDAEESLDEGATVAAEKPGSLSPLKTRSRRSTSASVVASSDSAAL